MRSLDLDPSTPPTGSTSAVGGLNVPMRLADLTINAGPIEWAANVGFTEGLNYLGVGLLGQIGFFDKFKVTFEHSKKLFHLELPEA
jgi:hypothetical protein